ncbi:MAG: O-antigen ligase family protein [Blastocatellia bacterium]|jgi:O-antigen ligase
MAQIQGTRENIYPLLVGTLLVGVFSILVLTTDMVLVARLLLILCSVIFLLRRPELSLAIQLNGIALYLYAIYKFNIETGTFVTGAFYGVMAGSYLIGGWVARRRDHRLDFHLVDRLFALLYSYFFVSYLLWSQDNQLAYRKVIYAPALVIAPYIGVRLISSTEKIDQFLRYVAAMSIIMIIPSFYELWTNPLYQDYGRFSIYIFEDKGDNPIQFGIAYALLLIVVIFRIARQRKIQLVDLLIIIPAAFLLIRSGARGPVISLIVTFFIYIIWLGHIRRRIKLAVVLGGAIFLIFAYAVIPDATVRFYQVLFDPTVSPTQNASANSIQERILLINLAVDDFLQHPIIGVGTGNSSGGVGYPHNSIIEVAAELGLVGVTIFLLLQGVVVATAYRTIRRVKGTSGELIMATAFAIYIFAFIESQFSGYMGGDMLLYVSIGLVAAASQLLSPRPEPERAQGG